jgi:hypothetical protein
MVSFPWSLAFGLGTGYERSLGQKPLGWKGKQGWNEPRRVAKALLSHSWTKLVYCKKMDSVYAQSLAEVFF